MSKLPFEMSPEATFAAEVSREQLRASSREYDRQTMRHLAKCILTLFAGFCIAFSYFVATGSIHL